MLYYITFTVNIYVWPNFISLGVLFWGTVIFFGACEISYPSLL